MIRIIRIAAIGLTLAVLVAPGAPAQQDLRSPDTRDAATRIKQDLRSPDTRDAADGRDTSVTVVRVPAPPEATGIEWTDTGIAVVGFVAIALAAFAVSRRRDPGTPQPTAG